MLPVLQRTAELTHPARVVELEPVIASDLGLSADERAQRLPSGRQGLLHNRLHWAKQYLTRAGLLEATERGRFQVTNRGQALLAERPPVVNNKTLARYPEFVAWLRARGDTVTGNEVAGAAEFEPPGATPEERIEAARQELEASLKADLLDRVRAMPPAEFEELVVTLLLRMGYGQGREEMAQALGGAGDGGVDGVIHQDRLGLDRVYIQAKRYRDGNTVGPDAINSFIGALNIKRANKGLFVTASTFSKQAREHAERSTTHVVLVDGDRLADLMVRHGVGVVVRHTVEIKAIDEGFFAE
ncbi:restriction endonuclease [Phenylobacterium soli]|nr:restriction endonuclease [Phenylobacterium soli]